MTAQIAPFHAIAIGQLAYKLAAEGQSVIHMEYGQPSTGAPAAAISAAHRVLDMDPMADAISGLKPPPAPPPAPHRRRAWAAR